MLASSRRVRQQKQQKKRIASSSSTTTPVLPSSSSKRLSTSSSSTSSLSLSKNVSSKLLSRSLTIISKADEKLRRKKLLRRPLQAPESTHRKMSSATTAPPPASTPLPTSVGGSSMASNPPVKLTSAAGMDTTATSTPTKKASQGTTTTAIGMPSPTGSTSETSDYQRSTPSPRGEHDSGIGSLEEWVSSSSSTSSAGSTTNSSNIINNNLIHQHSDSDPGYSESGPDEIRQNLKHLLSKNLETDTANLSTSKPGSGAKKSILEAALTSAKPSTTPASTLLDPRLRFQQVRVAIKKLPVSVVAKTSESNSSTIIKRRHSEQESTESKKARLATNSLTYENSKAERSLSLEEDRKPAPISAKKTSSYLSESKKFTALRKEKLDQFLNLKTDNHHHEEQQKARDQIRNSLCRPGSENSKNDLPFGIKIDPSSSEAQSSSFCPSPFSSPLKVEKSNSSSNSGDLKPAETPCPTAATVKLDDSFCFEAPNPIRFPVNKSLSERMICKWTDCGIEEDSAGKLLDHLKLVHATSQNLDNKEDFLYKCFWTGCKVYGKGSSSKSWLEKHVTNHGGNKPFQCIVDGCKMRFGTQSLLERHVNNHFKSPASSSSAPNSSGGSGKEYTARKSGEPMGSLPTPPPSAIKLIRKAGKKLKYRKTIFSARIFDLFDLGVMAQVQERLTLMSARGKNELNITGESVNFVSEVLARKKDDKTGETKLLLRWKPHDILDDEWVSLDSAKRSKTIPINSLPHSAKASLSSKLQHGVSIQDQQPQRQQFRSRKNKNPQQSRESLS